MASVGPPGSHAGEIRDLCYRSEDKVRRKELRHVYDYPEINPSHSKEFFFDPRGAARSWDEVLDPGSVG